VLGGVCARGVRGFSCECRTACAYVSLLPFAGRKASFAAPTIRWRACAACFARCCRMLHTVRAVRVRVSA
jgi:hypothetical protein